MTAAPPAFVSLVLALTVAGTAGKLDTSFGDHGFAVSAYTGLLEEPAGIAVQGSSILLVGSGRTPDGTSGLLLYRYASNGRPAGSSAVRPAGGGSVKARAVVRGPHGSVLVAVEPAPQMGIGLMRLTGGLSIVPTPAFPNVLAAAEDPQGRTVVVGKFAQPSNGAYVLAAARFLPNGRPDGSFGTNGLLADPAQPEATAIVTERDGSIVVASDRNVVRYRPNGARERVSPTLAVPGPPTAIVRDARGGFVVVGETQFSPYKMYAARLTGSLALDRTFGQGGIAPLWTLFGSNVSSSAEGVLTERGGSVLVVGADASHTPCSTWDLIRLTAGGRVAGRTSITSPKCSWGAPFVVARQPGGRLLLSGRSIPGGQDDYYFTARIR